ncbi:MAG: Rab family GTPase [Mariprofundaceae bacterium]
MYQMKVCMLGSFGVGKTSLVQRFVKSIFSEKYHTTLGVKVDKKELQLDGQAITMMLWDIHGEETLKKVKMSYLRGAAGYLLVIDGTRKQTIDVALELHQRVKDEIGVLPVVFVLNKADLHDDWELTDSIEQQLKELGFPVLRSSALSGEGVEMAFSLLAEAVIQKT